MRALSYVAVAAGAMLVGAAGASAVRRAAPPAPTTHGEWVYIKKGADSIRAYVAYPERKDKAPGVIVIHEIFGLTDWEPTVADRLAKEGFVAIVPDLLSSKHGKSPQDENEGRKLIGELEPERITADLDATYAYLNCAPVGAEGRHRHDRVLLGRGTELPLRDQQPEPERRRRVLRSRARHRDHAPDQGAGARASTARTTRASTRPCPT